MDCRGTKIVAVIQARMGAERLPNKMMLTMKGHPVINWVVERVKRAKMLDDVVVAIPDTKTDDILEQHLRGMSVSVYRGSEYDVLKRMHGAAEKQCKTGQGLL